MLELLIAFLLATGSPVPPELQKYIRGTTVTTQGDDGDTGGDNGHVPPGTPPPPPPKQQ